MRPFHVPKSCDIYDGGDGSLGVIDKRNRDVEWMVCRDGFQSYSLGRFLFKCVSGQIPNTIAFIRRVERAIKLPVRKRCVLRLTDKPDILYIGLKDFWRTEVHRSLLTILLRAGEYYNPKRDNIRQVTKNCWYLRNTRSAFERFMKGYTHPIIRAGHVDPWNDFLFYGWVDWVGSADNKKVKKMLVKVKNAHRKRA